MHRKIRVLVVDDEILARRRLLRFLKAQPDAEVLEACATLPSALDTLEWQTPDVVFLDVDMPELDACDLLSALAPYRVPWVVFVATHGEDELRALNGGAVDYLLKPFDLPRFERVFARIRAALDGDRRDRAG